MSYERELDLLQQRITDLEERALLDRLRASCPDADDDEGSIFLSVCVKDAIDKGHRGLDARMHAIRFLEDVLNFGLLDSRMDVVEDDWLCTQGAGRCQHSQCKPLEVRR